jgi:hypothetical protein
MPRFQNVLPPIRASQQFVSTNRPDVFVPSLTATANAFADAGREMPQELVARGEHQAQ